MPRPSRSFGCDSPALNFAVNKDTLSRLENTFLPTRKQAMSTIETLIESYQFNRTRTLGILDEIEKMPDPAAVLAWRPGPGRAHIAWQLMHVGVTEELFATERLCPEKEGQFQELWPRFRGGSTPDDDIPSADDIRRVLGEAREHLIETLGRFNEDDLQTYEWTHPSGRVLNLLTTVHIIGWHEGHHQGQTHITLNLYKAAHA